MRAIVLLLGMIVPATGTAAVIGYTPGPTGRLDLHDSTEICVGGARYAEWLPATGGAVRGCWLVGNGSVRVVFLDGDVVTVPIGAVLKPSPA